MEIVYYHDVILTVRDSQEDFRKFSMEIFEEIKAVKKTQNTNLKLDIKTHDFFDVSLQLKSGFRISIIDMIKKHTGYLEDKHVYSLLWYMFSDLENVNKLFRNSTVRDAKNQWLSNTCGVIYGHSPMIYGSTTDYVEDQYNFPKNQVKWVEDHVAGPLPDYYSVLFKAPIFMTMITWGYTYDDTGALIKYNEFEDIERTLNIPSFFSILSPGYHRYISKVTNSDLKIPTAIRNKMDLKVLFKWISENKVTNRNIRRVLCHGTQTSLFYKQEIIKYINKEYPQISNYAWFDRIQKTFA